MRAISWCAVALACMFRVSLVGADDGLDTARKFVDFWQPLEGTWEIAVHPDDGEVTAADATFTWSLVRSPTGLCHLSEARLDGKVVGHAINGYDPAHKCWHWVGLGFPSEPDNTLLSASWLHIDLSKGDRLAEGVTFIVEGKGVTPEGTVVKTRSRWTCTKADADVIEITFSEATRDGEPEAGGKMVCTRKK